MPDCTQPGSHNLMGRRPYTDSVCESIEEVDDDVADVQTDVDAIQAETDKIDGAATDGLTGVADSVAYRAGEIETHIHSYERWFEKAAVPAGETHVADRIGGGLGAFRLDAGNDDWGGWVQLLGSSDTAAIFDPHKIEITGVERNEVYFLQIGFGASGAAALGTGQYTEIPFMPVSNMIDSAPVVVQARRQAIGTKVWARCMCPGQNTATLDLFPGVHFYAG